MLVQLMFFHFISDFILQTDTMAKNKSTSWKWLSAHVGTYMLVLFSGLFFLHSVMYSGDLELVAKLFTFVLANGILHFCIDAVTSRITSLLWKKQKVHEFFVVIGFDQFLHF